MDEFQDTSKAQAEVVDALIQRGVNVMLVGDERQSIYSFRGADIASSRAMRQSIHQNTGMPPGTLDKNFRASKGLLEHINTIFARQLQYMEHSIGLDAAPLAAAEQAPATMRNCFSVQYNQDIPKIVHNLMSSTQVQGKALEYGDIAVLCRRNADVARVALALAKTGIPVETVGGKGFFRAKEVVDTYKVFNAVLHPDGRHSPRDFTIPR